MVAQGKVWREGVTIHEQHDGHFGGAEEVYALTGVDVTQMCACIKTHGTIHRKG